MKFFFTLFLFSLPFMGQSQEEPISEEQLAMMAEMMFTFNKNVLKTSNCIHKEIDYVASDSFSEVSIDSDIAKCMEVIKSTGKLEFAEDWKKIHLFFKSEVPEKFGTEITEPIRTEFIQSNLKNGNGEVVELAKNNSGNSSDDEIIHKTQIGFEEVSMEGITGSATYKLRFLTGYDKVELTAKDLGKEFTMDNCQFDLLDVIENILIVEQKCDARISLSVINFLSDSKVVKSYSWVKLNDMKKEDETIEVNECCGSSSQVVPKQFYDTLASNPDMTFEQFKEVADQEFFENGKNGNKIVAIKQVGLYKNKFIIYTPIYKTEQVTIQY